MSEEKKPYNFIDEKKCSCGTTKMNPVEIEGEGPTGYICSTCRKPYDKLGNEIPAPEPEEVITMTPGEQNQPAGICPFMSMPGQVVICIGKDCHLWSDSTAFFGMQPGMCSIALAGEAAAFLSKGDALKEMGDRSMGGNAGG